MLKAWTLTGDTLFRRHVLGHSDGQVGAHLTAVMPRYGPLYIKAGQMMASRPDVVAREMREALTALESQVVPPSLDEVRNIVQRTVAVYPEASRWLSPARFSDDAGYDDLLAAGSVASVWDLGRPVDGKAPACVKVARAQVAHDIMRDTRAVAHVLDVLSALGYPGAEDTRTTFAECRYAFVSEADLLCEGSHLERFGRVACRMRGVRVPRLLLSTPDLVVMERMDGVQASVARAQYPLATRLDLADKLAAFYGRCMAEERIFHQDPHPGNVLFAPDEVMLLDFGQCVSARRLTSYLPLAAAAAQSGNHADVTRILLSSGAIRTTGSFEETVAEVRHVLIHASRGIVDETVLFRTRAGVMRLSAETFFLMKTFAQLKYLLEELVPETPSIMERAIGVIVANASLDPTRAAVEYGIISAAAGVLLEYERQSQALRNVRDTTDGMRSSICVASLLCALAFACGATVQ